ncbi:MAG TPA: hypothetical protein VG965_04170 [Patescibacteria group bacterium]|nr:hypothetical protein [Patescibacteria group bacterium]
MGKVKLKVVGDEQQEKEQVAEQKKKREEKAAKKATVKDVGLGGGERINAIGISEEEIANELEQKPVTTEGTEKSTKDSDKTVVAKKARKVEARVKGKKHTENMSHVAKATNYPIKNGVEMLRKFKPSKFDETVELHINVKEKGISGQVVLPHGTGKKLRIKIADDAIIAEVEKGKIDFDVLVAAPSMMPKLARVARVLGPRGLMPNPKSGTITDNPQQVIDKLSAGQINYKTESAAPIIHMSVGKLSFDDKKLEENISVAITSIGTNKIDNITLKSTMSPGIKITV